MLISLIWLRIGRQGLPAVQTVTFCRAGLLLAFKEGLYSEQLCAKLLVGCLMTQCQLTMLFSRSR